MRPIYHQKVCLSSFAASIGALFWASWAGSDSEVVVSLSNSLMERIGERTLELWGDLFVGAYGKSRIGERIGERNVVF